MLPPGAAHVRAVRHTNREDLPPPLPLEIRPVAQTEPPDGERQAPRHRGAPAQRAPRIRSSPRPEHQAAFGADTQPQPTHRSRRSQSETGFTFGPQLVERTSRRSSEVDRLAFRQARAKLVTLNRLHDGVEHEIPDRPAPLSRVRANLPMNRLRNVLDLKVCHEHAISMLMACSQQLTAGTRFMWVSRA